MNQQQTDLWIVAVYLLVMIVIAFFLRKDASRSLENFYLSGRKIPGWLNGISYTAALVSPDAATGYGGLAVVTGSFISWWYLSRFGLAFFLGGVLFAYFWRRLNLFTSLEFYNLRFPPYAANAMRLWIAVRTSLIAMPAWTGITLLAAYKIMGPSLGLTKVETLLLIVPVSFIYVFLSGYKGIVISNFIQMFIFFVGILSLALLTLDHFGGPVLMAEALRTAFGTSSNEMLSTFPPTDHNVFPQAAAMAWLMGQSIGYGGDAAPMGGAMEGQRILSSKSPGQALIMYVVTAFSMFIILLLITLPCISAASIWPSLRDPGADRELVYGLLMKTFLPAGFMGLMIAAMMAAVMSTVADNLNFGSQVMVSDLYRKWIFGNGSEKHYLIAGKIAMLIIISLSLIITFNVKIIIDVAIFMLQLSAAELPANWAQWWWWRFNGYARIAASFGGALIFLFVVLGPRLLIFMGAEWASVLVVPWWWQTLIVMGLTTTLWYLVAILTKPDPPELLENFYKTAKPLGAWKPFIHSPVSREKSPSYILYGLFISVLGFASIVLLITGLTNMWFAFFVKGSLQIAFSIILLVFFIRKAKYFIRMLEEFNMDN